MTLLLLLTMVVVWCVGFLIGVAAVLLIGFILRCCYSLYVSWKGW